MSRRSGVVIAFAAITELLLARAGHAQQWPPPPGGPPPEPPVAGPRVILQTDNPSARLQQHTQLRWKDICIAPCGMTMDPLALYRVGGGASIASEPFKLPRSAGDVYIDAEVGSKVKHWVGLGLMIGGLGAAAYGLVLWQFFKLASDNGTTSTSDDTRTFGRNLFIIFLSVGGILEAVGLPMFFSGTSVQVR